MNARCAIPPEQVASLIHWMRAEQAKTWIRAVPPVPSPAVRWFSEVSEQEKMTRCPQICLSPHASGLNMFMPEAGAQGEIWLADGARVDQLVHELRHAFERADNPETDGTSDREEIEAIQWQQSHEKAFGRLPLCPATQGGHNPR